MIRSILPLLAVLAMTACAPPMTFQTQMTGANQVPPVNTRGVGTVNATVYPATRALTYTVEYQNLSGPPTAAHFHGPALAGANAPPVVPSVVTPSPIKGGATLTAAQLDELMAGRWYYNVHTAQNPGGEIRGQMQRVQ